MTTALSRPDARDVTPGFRMSDRSAARVLRAIRFREPVARPDLSAVTGLSPATVGRAVASLIRLGVVRERPDLAHRGANGRPGIPVEIDPDGPVTVAVHIGLRTSVLAVCDLRCRLLASLSILTPQGGPDTAVDELCAAAFRALDDHRDRELVWGGIATAARVDGEGLVDHELLGWRSVPLARLFSDSLGVPFSIAPHVEAMAAAELLVGHETHTGTTLLVYGRESIGSALVIDGVVHQSAAGPADLTLVPFGTVMRLDDRGRGLEDTVADSGLLRAAGLLGLPAGSPADLARAAESDPCAHALLAERARALGRVVGTVSAVTRPDTVVLAGQAFTGAPRHLGSVVEGVDEVTVTGRRPSLRVTTAGDAVQVRGAMAVALDRITADPEGVLAEVRIGESGSLDGRGGDAADSAA